MVGTLEPGFEAAVMMMVPAEGPIPSRGPSARPRRVIQSNLSRNARPEMECRRVNSRRHRQRAFRESARLAANGPSWAEDLIDPSSQESSGEHRQLATKLPQKSPKTQNAESNLSASAVNSCGAKFVENLSAPRERFEPLNNLVNSRWQKRPKTRRFRAGRTGRFAKRRALHLFFSTTTARSTFVRTLLSHTCSTF
jgi:hypothetical protein